MSSMLDKALHLASLGFHVFPLVPGLKIPAKDVAFTRVATRDPAQIRQMWSHGQQFNVGIYTGRYGDDPQLSLCVLDVDDKERTKPDGSTVKKRGSDSLFMLEMDHALPPTFEQVTASGGRHLVFLARNPVACSVDKLGNGLDVRGTGGFIVGAGSLVGGREYTAVERAIAEAPASLIELCGRPVERDRPEGEAAPQVVDELDSLGAIEAARAYLRAAPRSIKGAGGDATAYRVAARVKDFGLSQEKALELMMSDAWNDGCGWAESRLSSKIEHAYRYGHSAVGASAPEVMFSPVAPPPAEVQRAAIPSAPQRYESTHPVNRLNVEHAYVIIGGNGFVLWETTDAEGKPETRLLAEDTFHRYYAGEVFPLTKRKRGPDGKEVDATVYESITKLWITSRGSASPPEDDRLWRRTYKGIWFSPGRDCPEGYYNAWRGFAYEPLAPGTTAKPGWQWALDAWKEHLVKNICRGDEKLAHWLTGWFAHLVQKPYEKPLTAVVFKGLKGTGKNANIERVAALFGAHSMVTHERRYIVSQFNGHMESMLLLVLDEAVWAGDKEGEGKLKGLTTGAHHAIERKGKEIYKVKNLLRLVIIGNEEWLVPASHDERRWAVFNVGNGRRKDKPFFHRMRVEMEDGGYGLLLRYLLDFDLSTVDVNEAPVTVALLEQKTQSLEPVDAWWLASLQEGTLIGGSNFGAGEWPEFVHSSDVQQALKRYHMDRNIRSRVPSGTDVQKALAKCAPGVKFGRRRTAGAQPYGYTLPPLEKARAEWSQHIGHHIEWDQQEV
jgi:hypothetical protein